MDGGHSRYCRFGSFVFDADRYLLTEAGKPVALKRQSASVLALLIRNAGNVVTRNEIRDHVWQGRTIEFDQGINACIRDVRRALGDSAPEARYVETLPKVGYRFIEIPKSAAHRRLPWIALIAAAVTLFALAIAAPRFWPIGEPSVATQAEMRVAIMPLRAESGPAQAAARTLMPILVASLVENQSQLKVISAAELFGDRDPAMADVTRWLEVDYLVAGQVREDAGAIVLNLRFIRTDGYVHLWSKTLQFGDTDGAPVTPELIAEMMKALDS